MRREFALSIACAALLNGLSACSAVEQDPQVAGRGEHASDAAQSLDLRADRPAAAAVGVLVDTVPTAPADHALRATRQLWLFACSSDHLLQRRVRANKVAKWSDWSIESATPCAGAPSASAWAVSPRDTVEVVYRSTDSRVIELSYQGDQAARETDLSTDTGFGKLASNCNPVIADMGTEQRVSIAVRNPENQLFALTEYKNAWHVQPARGPNGAQVFAESTLVAWYSDRTALLSAVHDGVSRVFQRSTWKQGFRAFSAPVPGQASYGLITFSAYQGRVQAIGRGADGALLASPVGKHWSFAPAPTRALVQSTMYLAAPFAYRAGDGVNMAALGIALEDPGRAAFLTGLDFFQRSIPVVHVENAHVASANTLVANPGAELWGDNFVADAHDQLLYWNGATDRRFTPMGLAVSY